MEPLAIVGISFKMPGKAVNEDGLWDIMETRKNVMTEWPESRSTVGSFHDGGSKKQNTISGRGAHFINQDPWAFDAPFFSVTSKEAESMDPQQRLILEASYHAFENADIPVEKLEGTQTAVFEASMSHDYSSMLSKDPDSTHRLATTGVVAAVRSNRVSWHFGLQGPSLHIDTACSSSMVALDLACQTIQCGRASAALVVGCNLLLTPDMSLGLSNMNFLSPDSVCYSFDSRANGYARGEGVIALVIKPISRAIADGYTIRAVIRCSASNQDGRTPVITQPSVEAQEALIRQVYRAANLELGLTRYFEAHGTGTLMGDPIEMKAIGRVFRSARSAEEPLYVGSVKANLGHLEGASGLAAAVKAVLILEKGIIPPNALFEQLNPDIDAEFYHTELVVGAHLSGLVANGWNSANLSNSFGIGGTNSHVVLDDAHSYLINHGLRGVHQCDINPILSNLCNRRVSTECVEQENGTITHAQANGHDSGFKTTIAPVENGSVQGKISNSVPFALSPKLLVWSAANEKALTQMVEDAKRYIKGKVSVDSSQNDRIAFTLACRRSHLPWRTFSVMNGTLSDTSKPVRVSSAQVGIALVFTGQGAQYAHMAAELIHYRSFKDTIDIANRVLKNLGCEWSIIG